MDNAGKTTLLRRLKDDRMIQHDPTLHPHAEELVLGNVRFRAFDLGGHQAVRKTWKNYFPTVDGIIYLVDSADKARFDESKKELDEILQSPELAKVRMFSNLIPKVPIVILGNKIDMKEAVSEEELKSLFGISGNQFEQNLKEADSRPMQIFMCSVAKKMGYAEGFRWLSQFLN